MLLASLVLAATPAATPDAEIKALVESLTATLIWDYLARER